MTNRREFLRHGAFAVAGLGALRLPRWVERAVAADPDAVRALVMRAVDAAKAAGATYADARFTRTLVESYTSARPSPQVETLGVSVRALVNGYWGFAGSSYCDADEVVRLARDAVAQAKSYGLGTPRAVDWTPLPAVTGAWSTPVRIDPFTVAIEEKVEFARAWMNLAREYDLDARPDSGMSFTRQERALATTEGTYLTQTIYSSGGGFSILIPTPDGEGYGSGAATGLDNAGAGWELFLDAKPADQIPAMVAFAREQLVARPTKAGDIGRYTVVFDAATMAALMAHSLGRATQVDRLLGYEANAGGVSYLGYDPLAPLGTAIASPLVSITADRTMARGLATVKWDGEGIAASSFPLVSGGALVDYQTTREQAAWLAPWYTKHGQPVASRGCADAESAMYETMQHMPNLTLEPGRQPASFEELVAGTPRGIAIRGGGASFNIDGGQAIMPMHQSCREIVNGKLGAELTGLMPTFGSAELWKHVVALGGATSVVQVPMRGVKGEPQQSAWFSVRAVPARVANVAFIDSPTRS